MVLFKTCQFDIFNYVEKLSNENQLKKLIYFTFNLSLFNRLYTAIRGGAVSEIVLSDAYKDVLENNIDMETSFNQLELSIEEVLRQPNRALFYTMATIQNMKKYGCQVNIESIHLLFSILYYFL